jgi:flagellar hook assembly protein FlgD
MMMKGRAAAALVAVVVATWGLLAAPASADGEPTTTPTITAPADGSNVSGDVQIQATSTEQQVQFYENGVAVGVPVATSGGTASTTWSTWGDANGGPVVWTAADCNDIGCNAVQSTGVSVSVLNDAPAITSPLDGTTTGPLPTFAATVGGGSLAFTLDGNVLGVVSTPPYQIPVGNPLADGAHSMWVTECNAAGTTCNGPTSTSNFTVVTPVLHPTITAVTPNPFSPHVDGRNDSTSFRLHLPGAETVTWSVRNSLAQTVNGPHHVGVLATGDHVFKWTGRNNANQIVADGTYTFVVSTSAPSGGLTLHGSVSAPVRVDDAASRVSIAAGNGVTFYPVVDGYADKFGPKVSVNEGGAVWLQILTTGGTLVNSIPKTHPAAGTFQVLWNGRNRANVLVPAGAYRFRFLAQDVAGNRSATGLGTVYVSHRHLVNKSVTLTKNGAAGVPFSTDPTCALSSTELSVYPLGLALGNLCDSNVVGAQVTGAEYVFTVPAAIKYNSIKLVSVGRTHTAPEIVAGLVYNYNTADVSVMGTSRLGQSNTNLVSVYGPVGAAGRVNGSRHVDVAVTLGDGPGADSFFDYDIARVSIVVAYSVLSS